MKDKRSWRRIGSEARRKRKRAWEDDCEGVSTEKRKDSNIKKAATKSSKIDERIHRILPVKEEETMAGDLGGLVARTTDHHVHCNSDGRHSVEENKCPKDKRQASRQTMWNQPVVETNSGSNSCNSHSDRAKKKVHQEDEYSKRTATVRLKRGKRRRESGPKTQDDDENARKPPPLAAKKLEEIRPSRNNSALTEERDYYSRYGLPFPPTLDLFTLKEVTIPPNWASKCAAYRATNRKDYTGEVDGSTLPLFFVYFCFHCFSVLKLVTSLRQVDSSGKFQYASNVKITPIGSY